MLIKLNRFLRNILIIVGAVCVILKLADSKINQSVQKIEGFQTKEFDDIW